MSDENVKNIVVVGNGTEGWMVAYMLASAFSRLDIRVTYASSADSSARDQVITSVSNYADLHPLLNLADVDIKKFFNCCDAVPYVGNRYMDAGRNVDFIHSFTGYERSYGRRINDDMVPLLKQLMPDLEYQDFSFTAQMALQGKFYSKENIQENGGLLNGLGVSFLKNSLQELLKGARKEEYFAYLEYCDLATEVNPDGNIVVYFDGSLCEADLYIDVTGKSALLINRLGKKDSYPAMGMDVSCLLNAKSREAVVADCVYNDGVLSKRATIGTYSQDTSFSLGQQSEAFIFAKPWVNNLIALGEASGSFPKVVYSELDLVITQTRLLIEAFPHSKVSPLKQQYFNRATHQQLYWLYTFNWMAIHFHQMMIDFKDQKSLYRIPHEIRERLLVFSKTGFVFTEDHEIFSDSFWKSFFIGSRHLYAGGLGCLSNNVELLIDLLKEKISIHREISQMNESGYLPCKPIASGR